MPSKERRPLFGARGADERPSVQELNAHSTNLKIWLQAALCVIVGGAAIYAIAVLHEIARLI